MFKVTEENYHNFLTFHGMTVECAEWVVARFDNTENYHKIKSVELWVDASKMVLKLNS